VLLHNRKWGPEDARKREPSAVSPNFLILRSGECELIIFELWVGYDAFEVEAVELI
jgi:hypothetical protein